MDRNYTSNSCRCISVHTINYIIITIREIKDKQNVSAETSIAAVDPIDTAPFIAIARRYLNSVVLRLSRD